MPGFHVAQTQKGLEIDVHVITRNLAIFTPFLLCIQFKWWKDQGGVLVRHTSMTGVGWVLGRPGMGRRFGGWG